MGTKRCPYCAEEIQEQAVRCRYCRSRLTSFDVERWYRRQPDARLAGVCAAVARVLALPVAAVRLAFVVLTFFHLLGPVMYVALWLVIPREPGGESGFELFLRWALDLARSFGGGHGEPPQGPTAFRPLEPEDEPGLRGGPGRYRQPSPSNSELRS